jgi:hypothetical protein
MPLLSRRLDQIIARRRHARPKDRARNLINLGYQLDGITEDFPTTETPYLRTRFTYEPNPLIADITPEVNDNFIIDRKVSFGTITVYPTDNLPPVHPSGTHFPSSDYPDWNRHAPTLLDFIEFIDVPWDDNTKKAVIEEYWTKRFGPTPTSGQLLEELAQARGAHLEAPQVQVQVDGNISLTDNEEDTTIATTTREYPSDEDSTAGTSTSSSDDESTPSKRQKRFNSYTTGPCVPCTVNNSVIPGRLLDTYIFGRTLLTHLDSSGRQFTILPGKDYHFNDVTITLDESRTGLEIVATCPEIVDVTEVPDLPAVDNSTTVTKTEEGDNTAETRKRPFYESTGIRPYNTRTNLRPTPTDDSSVSTLPTAYQDPDYAPSDTGDDISTSSSDNESGTCTSESNVISTSNAFIDLSVETIDLTQTDTEYEEDSEAGDVIVYNVTTSTEFL